MLSEVADVTYLVSSLYDPLTEAGIAWDDPDVGVDWQVDEPLLTSATRAPRSSPKSPRRSRSSAVANAGEGDLSGQGGGAAAALGPSTSSAAAARGR